MTLAAEERPARDVAWVVAVCAAAVLVCRSAGGGGRVAAAGRVAGVGVDMVLASVPLPVQVLGTNGTRQNPAVMCRLWPKEFQGPCPPRERLYTVPAEYRAEPGPLLGELARTLTLDGVSPAGMDGDVHIAGTWRHDRRVRVHLFVPGQHWEMLLVSAGWPREGQL